MSAQVITHPREQVRQLRATLAAAVERLIAWMDEIDGDPDMELSGDETEMSLATMDGRNHNIDFTTDPDDREPDGDESEPELGAVINLRGDQTHWSEGTNDDREVDDDLEPNGDEGDYKIGETEDCGPAPFAMSQDGTKWAYGDMPDPSSI